jgi:hypothetical protein
LLQSILHCGSHKAFCQVLVGKKIFTNLETCLAKAGAGDVTATFSTTFDGDCLKDTKQVQGYLLSTIAPLKYFLWPLSVAMDQFVEGKSLVGLVIENGRRALSPWGWSNELDGEDEDEWEEGTPNRRALASSVSVAQNVELKIKVVIRPPPEAASSSDNTGAATTKAPPSAAENVAAALGMSTSSDSSDSTDNSEGIATGLHAIFSAPAVVNQVVLGAKTETQKTLEQSAKPGAMALIAGNAENAKAFVTHNTVATTGALAAAAGLAATPSPPTKVYTAVKITSAFTSREALPASVTTGAQLLASALYKNAKIKALSSVLDIAVANITILGFNITVSRSRALLSSSNRQTSWSDGDGDEHSEKNAQMQGEVQKEALFFARFYEQINKDQMNGDDERVRILSAVAAKTVTTRFQIVTGSGAVGTRITNQLEGNPTQQITDAVNSEFVISSNFATATGESIAWGSTPPVVISTQFVEKPSLTDGLAGGSLAGFLTSITSGGTGGISVSLNASSITTTTEVVTSPPTEATWYGF